LTWASTRTLPRDGDGQRVAYAGTGGHCRLGRDPDWCLPIDDCVEIDFEARVDGRGVVGPAKPCSPSCPGGRRDGRGDRQYGRQLGDQAEVQPDDQRHELPVRLTVDASSTRRQLVREAAFSHSACARKPGAEWRGKRNEKLGLDGGLRNPRSPEAGEQEVESARRRAERDSDNGGRIRGPTFGTAGAAGELSERGLSVPNLMENRE